MNFLILRYLSDMGVCEGMRDGVNWDGVGMGYVVRMYRRNDENGDDEHRNFRHGSGSDPQQDCDQQSCGSGYDTTHSIDTDARNSDRMHYTHSTHDYSTLHTTHRAYIKSLKRHLNLVQCHFQNKRFRSREPSQKSIQIQYPVPVKAIISMQYVRHDARQNESPVQWTCDERRLREELRHGFWVVSAMSHEDSYIGTIPDRYLLRKQRIVPRTFESRNALLFDMDVMTSPEVVPEKRNGKVLVGKGMQIDNKVNQITSSMFSCRLVAGGNDRNLVTWNMATGKVQSILQGHRGAVYACKVFNEQYVVSAGRNTICLWDVDRQQLVQHVQGSSKGPVYGILVERGNCIVSYAKDGFLRVFAFHDGRLSEEPVLKVAITDDHHPIYHADMYLSSIVASDREGNVAYFDLRLSTEPIHVWKPNQYQENAMVNGVALDAGKASVLCTDGSGMCQIHVYETLTDGFAEVSRWEQRSYLARENVFFRTGNVDSETDMERYNQILVPDKDGNLLCVQL